MQTTNDDLRASGFSCYDISLLGCKDDKVEKLGSAYWRAEELEGAVAGGFFFLGSYIAMAALLTPVSTLAGSIAAIAIGGGPAAVFGAILARRMGQQHRCYHAVKILKAHSGRDVHVQGWSE